MKIKNIIKFVIAIAVCQAAGLIGSIFTAPKISAWYASLNKPSFSPPNWIFAPVWTILFILMGISLYLAWVKLGENRRAKTALIIFAVQLALNILWSFLFFGMQNPFFAFVEIIVLWIAILASIIAFWKVDKKAAYLMLPYILWVSFAAFLNYVIFAINK